MKPARLPRRPVLLQSFQVKAPSSPVTTPLWRRTVSAASRSAARPPHVAPSTLFARARLLLARRNPTSLLQRLRSARFNSSKSSPTNPNPTPNLGSPEPALTLSQRLKKLSREYGWSALGVYLALSALDFPFCFLAVRMLGTDRIGHYEHVVIEAFWNVIGVVMPNARQGKEEAYEGAAADPAQREGQLGWSEEMKAADAKNKSAEATIWTQLALAYAIHKSFIFLRVPLTAAVTPKVVKVLRGWGWDIGKRKPKAK